MIREEINVFEYFILSFGTVEKKKKMSGKLPVLPIPELVVEDNLLGFEDWVEAFFL